MATTAKPPKRAVDHLHQLVAYARNAAGGAEDTSLERLVRQICEDLEIPLDDKQIAERRKP